MDLTYYRDLLLQPPRLDAFRRGLAAVIRPGDRVLEIGTGLGTYAFFAAAAGAGEVWAVDDDPVVHLAEDIARLNNVGTIRWVRGRVPDVTVPPPDVVIYEDFSPRLLDAGLWRLWDAIHRQYATSRTRFVPARARLWVTAADLPGLMAVPHGPNAHGIAWEALAPYLANLPRRDLAGPDQLAGAPAPLLDLDLARPPAEWSLGGSVRVPIERACSLTALVLWHELEVAPGVVLDNAPGAKPGSWGHVVLPCEPAIEVAAGDVAEIEVRWDPDAQGTPTWLRWSLAAGGRSVRSSEFGGFPASRADLVSGTPQVRPRVSPAGARLGDMLGLADGTRTAAEIAAALGKTYPAMDEATLLSAVLSHVRSGLLVPGGPD